MRPLLWTFLFLLGLISGAAAQELRAQDYRPKFGETVIRLEIAGRGDVVILLRTHEAPRTTARILQLVREGFYDGQRFHRVDNSPKPYLVQIGDPASKTGDLSGNGGSGVHIPFEETGFTNIEGAVGLSRPTGDRQGGDSQFYMLLDRASFLDGNYTVFGQVVAGMDVLHKVVRGDRVARITVLTG